MRPPACASFTRCITCAPHERSRVYWLRGWAGRKSGSASLHFPLSPQSLFPTTPTPETTQEHRLPIHTPPPNFHHLLPNLSTSSPLFTEPSLLNDYTDGVWLYAEASSALTNSCLTRHSTSNSHERIKARSKSSFAPGDHSWIAPRSALRHRGRSFLRSSVHPLQRYERGRPWGQHTTLTPGRQLTSHRGSL